MGTQVQSITDQIKRELANVRSTIAPPSGNTISTKSKLFHLPTGQTSRGPIQAVILDYRNYNRYYDTPYNSMNPKPPACFAIAKHHEALAPHPGAEKPQAEDCASCPHNQWNSDRNGKGKACTNMVRLAIVPPDATPETKPMLLNASPTALRSWQNLVTSLESGGMLTVQAIVDISFDPNVDYPKLEFKFVKGHDKLERFWALREAAQAALDSAIGD